MESNENTIINRNGTEQLPDTTPETAAPRTNRSITPFTYGLIAAAAILTIYTIGSSILAALFADSISSEGLDITTPKLFTATILGQILFLLLPTLFLASKGPMPIRNLLRLHKTSISYFVLAGLGVLAARVLGGVWLMVQELYLIPDGWMAEYLRLQKSSEWLNEHLMFGSNIPLLLFAIIAAAVIPALSEEFLFRGMVQRSMEERLKPIAAILLTGAIFGAIHFQPTNFIPLAGIGAVLGVIAWSSHSIWPAIFGHFFFNAAQVVISNVVVVSVLDTEREEHFTGDDLLALLPIALISALALLAIIRQLLSMRGANWLDTPLPQDSPS